MHKYLNINCKRHSSSCSVHKMKYSSLIHLSPFIVNRLFILISNSGVYCHIRLTLLVLLSHALFLSQNTISNQNYCSNHGTWQSILQLSTIRSTCQDQGSVTHLPNKSYESPAAAVCYNNSKTCKEQNQMKSMLNI